MRIDVTCTKCGLVFRRTLPLDGVLDAITVACANAAREGLVTRFPELRSGHVDCGGRLSGQAFVSAGNPLLGDIG
jgi:hypothetical protein